MASGEIAVFPSSFFRFHLEDFEVKSSFGIECSVQEMEMEMEMEIV